MKVKKLLKLNGEKKERAVPQTQDKGVQLVKQVAPCSIEFSRNAKQEPSWSIKAYSERDDLEGLADEVIKLDTKLRRKVGAEEE